VLKKSLEQGKGAKRAPARKKASHPRKRKSA
jgi:hypothetical protein